MLFSPIQTFLWCIITSNSWTEGRIYVHSLSPDIENHEYFFYRHEIRSWINMLNSMLHKLIASSNSWQVDDQPVSMRLSPSLMLSVVSLRWVCEALNSTCYYPRTNIVPVEEILVIHRVTVCVRSRIWGYTSMKSLYRGEQHPGHTSPFIFRFN